MLDDAGTGVFFRLTGDGSSLYAFLILVDTFHVGMSNSTLAEDGKVYSAISIPDGTQTFCIGVVIGSAQRDIALGLRVGAAVDQLVLVADLLCHDQYVAAGLGVAFLSFLLDQQIPGNVTGVGLLIEIEHLVAFVIDEVLDDAGTGVFLLLLFLGSSSFIAHRSCGAIAIEDPLAFGSIRIGPAGVQPAVHGTLNACLGNRTDNGAVNIYVGAFDPDVFTVHICLIDAVSAVSLQLDLVFTLAGAFANNFREGICTNSCRYITCSQNLTGNRRILVDFLTCIGGRAQSNVAFAQVQILDRISAINAGSDRVSNGIDIRICENMVDNLLHVLGGMGCISGGNIIQIKQGLVIVEDQRTGVTVSSLVAQVSQSQLPGRSQILTTHGVEEQQIPVGRIGGIILESSLVNRLHDHIDTGCGKLGQNHLNSVLVSFSRLTNHFQSGAALCSVVGSSQIFLGLFHIVDIQIVFFSFPGFIVVREVGSAVGIHCGVGAGHCGCDCIGVQSISNRQTQVQVVSQGAGRIHVEAHERVVGSNFHADNILVVILELLQRQVLDVVTVVDITHIQFDLSSIGTLDDAVGQSLYGSIMDSQTTGNVLIRLQCPIVGICFQNHLGTGDEALDHIRTGCHGSSCESGLIKGILIKNECTGQGELDIRSGGRSLSPLDLNGVLIHSGDALEDIEVQRLTGLDQPLKRVDNVFSGDVVALGVVDLLEQMDVPVGTVNNFPGFCQTGSKLHVGIKGKQRFIDVPVELGLGVAVAVGGQQVLDFGADSGGDVGHSAVRSQGLFAGTTGRTTGSQGQDHGHS